MADALVWQTIAEGDLGAPPTSIADPNVIDTRNDTDVALSADMTGGASPVMTVTVFYFDEASGTFELTGDLFVLDPAVANLAVANPNGLRLGFTATTTGGPATADLNVGRRTV